MEKDNTKKAGPQSRSRQSKIPGWLLKSAVKVIIPACIVVLAVGFAKHQIDSRPKAIRKKPPRQSRLVTVQSVHRTDCATTVNAMGTVIPAKTVTIDPEVSGRINSVAPEVVPGGIIKEGQLLLRIDSRDYETIVKQRESARAKARLDLKLELGNQSVAKEEYEMLGEVIDEQDRELVLRKPHLKNAQSALDASRAAVNKAKLDVERCTITAPFNAIIKEKHVDPGARVSPSSPLITVIGTDEYWVEVLVPVNQLQWIDIQEEDNGHNPTAKIFNSSAWGDDVYREGKVLRLLGGLEEKGRMAQLLVSIKDPLCLKRDKSIIPIVLTGSFVSVEIQGRTIPSVVPVKREYIRDGDKVWVMNSDNQLEIRPVKIVFSGKNTVYLTSGIDEGEQIITTDISAPVDGMPVRLEKPKKGSGK
jgi:RND family efflux transporter MFP subunit